MDFGGDMITLDKYDNPCQVEGIVKHLKVKIVKIILLLMWLN